jgi:hypothetical protein
MTSLSKQQMDAAQEFANATISALKLGQGVHAATVIAATARMAGTYLFRSFGLKLLGVKPGQAVLSDAANEQGPRLIQITHSVLSRMAIKLDSAQSDGITHSKNEPMLGFLDTQKKLEPLYTPIKARQGLTAHEAAQAAAVATALLIRHFAQVLDANVAFGIAVYGFIEGSKTAPEPVEICSQHLTNR